MNFFKYEKQKENFTSIIPLVTKEKSSVSSKAYTNSTLQCSCKKKYQQIFLYMLGMSTQRKCPCTKHYPII